MTQTKNNLTIEAIEEFMKELHYKYEASPRQMVIYTGQAGMQEINFQMERVNNRDYADFLYEKGVLSLEEKNSVVAMIDSPDRENYEMAKIILQTKSETNSNIKPCQLYSKPPITNTKALIQMRELSGPASQVLLVSSNKNLTP